MITFPKHIQTALQELTDKGFAVVIFTPKELNGADANYVENAMTQSGWDAINYNKDPDAPTFDWEMEDESYPD